MQVLSNPAQQPPTLVGLAAPSVGPGPISAAHSFVTGLDAPLVAGNASFALWLRDADAQPIVADPQVQALAATPAC